MMRDPGARFRAAIALYFLYYFAHLALDFSALLSSSAGGFSPDGGMSSRLGFPDLFSHGGIRLFYGMLVAQCALMILLLIDRLPIWLIPIAWFGNLAIHWAIPFSIHEAQPLHNFLLLGSFGFLRWNTSAPNRERLARTLVFCLSGYYLAVGAKKLPDPHWVTGDALHSILTWAPIAKHNFVARLFRYSPLACRALQLYALAFELGHFALVRWAKRYVFWLGMALHLGIFFSLNVGSFSWLMIAWNVLLFPA